MSASDAPPRCRVCGRVCLWVGVKDHVGRPTSAVRLEHHSPPEDGHEAVPQFVRVEESS